MKTSHFLIILTTAALLGSCSIFNKTTGKYDDASDNSQARIEASSPQKKNKKKKNATKQQNDTMAGNKPDSDELTGSQWTITTVGKDNIPVEDEMPYAIFDAKGNFYGNNGCNVINGNYVLRSDGKMLFSKMLSTMALCPDKPYADAIAAIFSDGKQYNVDYKRIGQESYLYLKDESDKTLVTMRRHNMEFLNGNWQIVSAGGKSIDDDEANLFIDIAELKVHGNTGCNFFNGTLYIDPSRSNAIDFSNMGLTRMACPKAEQEHRIIVSLEEAASAIAGKKHDTVLILNKKGKEVMTLRRIENDK